MLDLFQGTYAESFWKSQSGMLGSLQILDTSFQKAHVVLQVWDSVSSLPIPRLNNATPENCPIFFIHGVGFGLVRSLLSHLELS